MEKQSNKINRPGGITRFWRKYFTPESVYFYTFHKCASTLFSRYVLQNVKRLNHIDYARTIFRGYELDKITFETNGYIYGPIRLSAGKTSTVYKLLIEPASQPDFIRDKTAIFLIRDPRDIMISAYYSFGYSHSMSPVEEIRERQKNIRDEIQNKTMDEYVLESASVQNQNFALLHRLSAVCERSVVIKYEDMIDNFDFFVSQLTKYLSLSNQVIEQIYKRSRPKIEEDPRAHRRSGKAGDFRNKLKPETIKLLNKKLDATLKTFNYAD